jgi:hypothetical protein
MIFYCDDENERRGVPAAEVLASYAKVSAWFESNEKAGRIVGGAGARLQPARTARTVRIGNGKTVVSDGPFAETKETIGGFVLVEARDIESVVEMAESWPGLPIAIEVRPVLEL